MKQAVAVRWDFDYPSHCWSWCTAPLPYVQPIACHLLCCILIEVRVEWPLQSAGIGSKVWRSWIVQSSESPSGPRWRIQELPKCERGLLLWVPCRFCQSPWGSQLLYVATGRHYVGLSERETMYWQRETCALRSPFHRAAISNASWKHTDTSQHTRWVTSAIKTNFFHDMNVNISCT